MVTATKIKTNLEGFNGEAHLWELSEPVEYGWSFDESEKKKTTQYVITSSVYAFMSGPETFIFPGNENGEVIDWCQMEGSRRGSYSHKDVIEFAGWAVK